MARTLPDPPPAAAPAPSSQAPDRVVIKHVGIPGWAVVALVALTGAVASLGTMLLLRWL